MYLAPILWALNEMNIYPDQVVSNKISIIFVGFYFNKKIFYKLF